MRIQQLKDDKSIEVLERFKIVIEGVRQTEEEARAKADSIFDQVDSLFDGPRPSQPAPFPVATTRASVHTMNRMFERITGDMDEIVSIEFLEAGLIAKRPVGKLRNDQNVFGTGFLVGHGIMLTAAHCVPTSADASEFEFVLDDEGSALGAPLKHQIYRLNPERFHLIDPDLDIALFAVSDFTGLNPPIDSYGWHVLHADEDIFPPQPVSIIQHPKGKPKQLVVHNSRFIEKGGSTVPSGVAYCWYTGDTQGGSSGAPVFDLRWQVVAMHHAAIPETNDKGEILGRDGEPLRHHGTQVKTLHELQELEGVSFVANEGVRASQIVARVRGFSMADAAMDALRKQLLALWSQPGAWRVAQAAAGKPVGLV